ncbi:MAG: TetR-like C-terminal domain-containing protein [Faecalispora jeddahensis]
MIGILSCESGELFLRFFRQYLNELITKHLLAGVKRKNQIVPEEFLVNHIAGSFVGMVQWWIKNDMRQSPEELAKYFLSVTLPVM